MQNNFIHKIRANWVSVGFLLIEQLQLASVGTLNRREKTLFFCQMWIDEKQIFTLQAVIAVGVGVQWNTVHLSVALVYFLLLWTLPVQMFLECLLWLSLNMFCHVQTQKQFLNKHHKQMVKCDLVSVSCHLTSLGLSHPSQKCNWTARIQDSAGLETGQISSQW